MVWVPSDPAGYMGWAGARLFVASVSGHILEADFHARGLTRSIESHAGAVWSLAAYSVASALSSKAVIAGSVLAAGCEDGSIRLFGVPYAAPAVRNEDDAPPDSPTSMLPPAGIAVCPGTDGRVLSLAWHPSTPLLFAGTNTGVIRGWDMSGVAKTLDGEDSDEDLGGLPPLPSSRIGVPMPVVRMQLESHSRADTLVWCMAVTSDVQVVAGDSLGNVTVWDGRTGTPAVSTPILRHDADVLALSVAESREKDSAVGVTVASAGVDGRVMIARRLPGKAASKWVALGAHRAHTHDVRTVALLGYAGGSNAETLVPVAQTRLACVHDRLLVLSGSADTQLGLLRVKQLGTHVPRRLAAFSARRQLIAFASRAALIVSYTAAGVDVWNVRRMGEGPAAEEEEEDAADAEASEAKPATPVPRGRKRGRAAPTPESADTCDHALLLSIAAGDARGKAAVKAPVSVDVSADGRWLAYAAAGGALHIVHMTLTPGAAGEYTTPVWEAAEPVYAAPPSGIVGTVSHLMFLDSGARAAAQLLIAISCDRMYVMLCSDSATMVATAGAKRDREASLKPSVALLYSLPISRSPVSAPASVLASAATTIVTPKSSGTVIRKPGASAMRNAREDEDVDEDDGDGDEGGVIASSSAATRVRASTPAAAASPKHASSAAAFAVTHIAQAVFVPAAPAATPSKLRAVAGLYGGGSTVPSWASSPGAAGSHLVAVAVHTPAAEAGPAGTYVHVYAITRSRGGLLRSLPRATGTLTSLSLLTVPVARRSVVTPSTAPSTSVAHVLLAGTTTNALLSYAAVTGEPLSYLTRAGAAMPMLQLFAPASTKAAEAAAKPAKVQLDTSALAPTDTVVASLCMESTPSSPAFVASFSLHSVGIVKALSVTPGTPAVGKDVAATGPVLNISLRLLARRFTNVLSAGVLTPAPETEVEDVVAADLVVVELSWRSYSRHLAAGALVRKTYAS